MVYITCMPPRGVFSCLRRVLATLSMMSKVCASIIETR